MLVRDPERAWSVASLATEVAMSRSAFAARFAKLPMHCSEQGQRFVLHAAEHLTRSPATIRPLLRFMFH
jgi:AraC-like DNA-binding protein